MLGENIMSGHFPTLVHTIIRTSAMLATPAAVPNFHFKTYSLVLSFYFDLFYPLGRKHFRKARVPLMLLPKKTEATPTSFDASVGVESVIHQQDQSAQRVGVQRHGRLESLWLWHHNAPEIKQHP